MMPLAGAGRGPGRILRRWPVRCRRACCLSPAAAIGRRAQKGMLPRSDDAAATEGENVAGTGRGRASKQGVITAGSSPFAARTNRSQVHLQHIALTPEGPELALSMGIDENPMRSAPMSPTCGPRIRTGAASQAGFGGLYLSQDRSNRGQSLRPGRSMSMNIRVKSSEWERSSKMSRHKRTARPVQSASLCPEIYENTHFRARP